MFTAGTVLFVAVTYLLMVAAVYRARLRRFHVPVMATIVVIDIFFPVYLYLTKDWIRRLFENEEIFSFLIWMHLILVITLYTLYVFQVKLGRRLLAGDETARADHRAQGRGILVVRALMVITGALLVEPPEAVPPSP